MGPIIIFDKSTLQSLSIDESVWLDNFFTTNITPLFYIETLADLSKENTKFIPEKIVRNLALKTPLQHSYPNIHHSTLVFEDLLGNSIEMSNRIILSGGETKISPDGKIGIHYNQFPEAAAMNRWQEENFLEIEQKYAEKWRSSLSNINFNSMIGIVKNIIPTGIKFRELKEIKDFTDDFIKNNDKEIYYLAFEILSVPSELQSSIIDRWYDEKKPSLYKFAPYAAYVFKVYIFFFLSLFSDLISKDRPSNIIDLAYLFYLPFCMVFTSNDRLHNKTTPLFIGDNQVFIIGQNLKASLNELDNFYSKLPENIKSRGINEFAVYPPEDIDTLVVQLWDRFLPEWRNLARKKKEEPPLSAEKEKEQVKNIKKQIKEARPFKSNKKITEDKTDRVFFKRIILTKKGKWKLVPPEVKGV